MTKASVKISSFTPLLVLTVYVLTSFSGYAQSYNTILDHCSILSSTKEKLDFLDTKIVGKQYEIHPDTIALLYIEKSKILFRNNVSIGQAIDALDEGLSYVNIAEHPEIWLECWFNKGYWYRKWDKYNEAKHAINQVLEYGNSEIRWKATIQLGKIYKDRGDFSQALKTYEEAIILADDDVYKLADTYEVISFVYLIMESEEGARKAIPWLEKLIDLIGPLEGYEHFTASMTYNLATAYMTFEDFDKAEVYFDKAKVAIDACCVDEDFESLLLEARGIILFEKGEYDKAIALYEEAIALYDESFDLTRSDGLASTYHQIALIYQEKGDLHNAIVYIDKTLGYRLAGIDSGIDCADISLERLRSNGEKHYLIEELITKAKIIKEEYDKVKDEEILRHALMTLEHCDLLVDYMRMEQIDDKSKLFWRERTSEVYDLLVSVNYTLQNFDKAFHYVEKARYLLAGEHLAQTHPTPSDEMLISRGLLDEYNEVQNELDKLTVQKEGRDSLLLVKNNLEKKQDDLLIVMKRDYPTFYEANFLLPIASVEEIRESLITEGQTFIEFHIYEERLYRFVVNMDGVLMTRTDSIVMVSENMIALREAITCSDRMSKKSLSAFADLGYEFYQLLFEGIDVMLKDELVIVNDPLLSLVPPSILLTTPIDVNVVANIRDWPFLIKNKAISHFHSASLALQFVNNSETVNNGNRLLGCRPSFGDDLALMDYSENVGVTREGLRPLYGARDEIKYLKSKVEGTYLEDEDATETNFKEMLRGSHAIIHIASHAIVDDEDAQNSKMMFVDDDENDGSFHAFEIQQEEISSDLIVLSACKTGYGKNEKGEGLNSLGLAFAKAGSPNMLTSLWAVSDKSTAILMTKFYDEVISGLFINSAIRNAQLSFLNAQPTVYHHPYYWGGFVYFGTNKSIELSSVTSAHIPEKNFNWMGIFVIGLLIIILYKLRGIYL